MTHPNTAEWNAQIYHEVSNPHVGWGAKVIEELHLQGNELIADLGCGTGRVTAQLLEYLPAGRVIAIDRSANMIDEARAHLEPRYPGQVTYLQSDLLDLRPPAIDQPVDLVFSTATFHWVRDHDTLFANIYALLRPGGRLVAQCGGGPNLRRHVDRSVELMSAQPYQTFFQCWESPKFYAEQEGTALRLQRAGFVNIATSLIPAPTILDGAKTLSTFLTNVVFREHLMQIPDPALQAAFIDELTRLAATDDPPFSLDYWRLNMRGVRPA